MTQARKTITGVALAATATLMPNSYADNNLDQNQPAEKESINPLSEDYTLKLRRSDFKENSLYAYMDDEIVKDDKRLNSRYLKALFHVGEVHNSQLYFDSPLPEEQDERKNHKNYEDYLKRTGVDIVGKWAEDNETLGTLIRRVESLFTFRIARRANGKNGLSSFGKIAQSEEDLEREKRKSIYVEIGETPFLDRLLRNSDIDLSYDIISTSGGKIIPGGTLNGRIKHAFGLDRIGFKYDPLTQDSSLTLQKRLNKPVEFTRIVDWDKKTTRKEHKTIGHPVLAQFTYSSRDEERKENGLFENIWTAGWVIAEKQGSNKNWQLFVGAGQKHYLLVGFGGSF